jgi:hypothetical protein
MNAVDIIHNASEALRKSITALPPLLVDDRFDDLRRRGRTTCPPASTQIAIAHQEIML